MADEILDTASLQAALTQLSTGVKETSDALRANSEVGVLLANVLSTTMDDKTRNRVLDIATNPKMATRDRRTATRDVMASHISKLARSAGETTKMTAHLGRISSYVRRIMTATESLHSGIQSLISSRSSKGTNNSYASGGPKAYKKAQKEKERLQELKSNWYSRKINRSIRTNPFLRTAMPGVVSRAALLGSYADSARVLGKWMYFKGAKGPGKFIHTMGAKVGRVGSAVAAGSVGAIAAIGGVALLAAIAVMVAKRVMATQAAVLQMRGRTGDERYNWWNQTQLEFKAGSWGYSQSELAKKQMEFAKAGFTSATDTGILESGLRSEKYFGVDNTAQYFQTLRRSTNAIQKYGTDLGKEFFSLRTIVRNTGMGLEELQQHQTGFMDSFKGATTKFQVGQVDALLANFKGLLASKETTGAELASFYNANQKIDTNTMLTTAWFADRGGFKFQNQNGDLLSKAFELRHMGSGDLTKRAQAFQAELKGLYDQFGVNKFSQLGGREKFIVTEQLMPQLLGIDVSKLPSVDAFMKRFDAGAAITGLDKETESDIKTAQETDTDRIVATIGLLKNPLETIANIIMRWATGSFLEARSYVKDEERKAEEKRNQDTVNDFNISVFNASDTKLTVKKGKPGQKAEVSQVKGSN